MKMIAQKKAENIRIAKKETTEERAKKKLK